MNTPQPIARRRRQVAVTQATIARAVRVAQAAGPEWRVVIKGDEVTLVQGGAAALITAADVGNCEGPGVRAMIAGMPHVLPRFVHHEVNRHGNPRWYFRRGHGPRIRLPDDYGTIEWFAAYDRALGGVRSRKPRYPDGSFAWDWPPITSRKHGAR